MRGQYFLPMVLIAMLVMASISMYFASTNQLSAYNIYSYDPFLTSKLTLAKSEIDRAFVEDIYWKGDKSLFNGVINAINNSLKTKDEMMQITYTTSSSGNKFNLNVDELKILSGDNYARTFYSYSYSVPFTIRTYRDPNRAYETNVFSEGETVYYWITGNNSDTLNVTIFRPSGAIYSNTTVTLLNWHWNSSFQPDAPGDWIIQVNDTTTNETIVKRVYYKTESIIIKTFNQTGQETNTFSVGDLLNVTVYLEDQTGNELNCPVKIAITDSNGKPFAGYQNATINGTLSKDFNLTDISQGSMVITATEQCMWYQNETTITVT